MAFNVDYNAALNLANQQAGALSGLGQRMADSGRKVQQGAIDADMNQSIAKALQGDNDALQAIMSQNPDVGMKIQDRLSQQGLMQQKQEQDQQDRLSSQMAMDTADVIEKIALADTEEKKRAIFAAAVGDDRYDIDKEDEEFFLIPGKQKAVIAAVKGPEYAEALFGKMGNASDTPASVRETEWFLKQTPETQKKHLQIKRKSDPTMAQKLEQKQAESNIEIEEAGKKTQAKGKAQRLQGYIDSGIEAADSLNNINKSIELLNSVETGGFDNAALRAKQFFGIESADEAQLASGLGKAILAQLKPIFGAAFTAAEGERLERIEANFGKSTEGNIRLLKEFKGITERAARRGLRAAKDAGDEFTVQEIQALLDAMNEAPTPTPAPASGFGSGNIDISDEDLLKKYSGG